jgi:hypothetical protein
VFATITTLLLGGSAPPLWQFLQLIFHWAKALSQRESLKQDLSVTALFFCGTGV